MVHNAPAIEQDRYRKVLGQFLTGVTVITAMDEDEPVGMAVNSFNSVSLEPPLVSYCASHSSSTWTRLQRAGKFCVNILGEDQEELCRRFATKQVDRFNETGWRPSETGSPILNGVLGWIECSTELEVEAGDHAIVVGRVLAVEVENEGRPLAFFRGGYSRLER